jgi:hypothetical protein
LVRVLLDPLRAAALRDWWADRRQRLLPIVIGLMSVAAAVWLTYELWRLLFQAPPWGAIDLRYRHTTVHAWFAREVTYSKWSVLDPPATHALLWPLLGWTTMTGARWVWAVTSLAALGWTAALTARHSGALTPHERIVAALLPLSIYASGATMGNGQLGVHLLPLLVAGCVRVQRGVGSWPGDLMTATLLIGALVKPNLTAPFMWIVFFVPGRLRPALLVVAGYAALTLLSASFQPADVVTLVRYAFSNATAISARPVPGNVANLHVWLGLLDLSALSAAASALAITLLGAWVYRHRRVDLWLLLGVTSYVALLSTYHRWYDEVLLVLPMVALFRLAKTSDDVAVSSTAGLILAVTIASSMAPGGLFLFPEPLNWWYVAGQVVIWVGGLAFLAQAASAARKAGAARSPAAARA